MKKKKTKIIKEEQQRITANNKVYSYTTLSRVKRKKEKNDKEQKRII